jgi:hypothetical protein
VNTTTPLLRRQWSNLRLMLAKSMLRFVTGVLFFACAAALYGTRALAAAAAGAIIQTPQQIRPLVDTPGTQKQPLAPRELMNKVVIYPSFAIGGVIPSRVGWQPCANPAGFLGFPDSSSPDGIYRGFGSNWNNDSGSRWKPSTAGRPPRR